MCFKLPVIALLASKTFQMINIVSSAHHHFERGDHFVARGAHTSVAKQSERNEEHRIFF